MKKFLIIIAALLIVTSGFFVMARHKKRPLFREIQPERGSISISFRETGSVSPRNRLEIKPPISGRIEAVAVVEGQRVKKGQTIAMLSSTERAALLDAARSKGEDEVKKWEEIYRPTPLIAPLDGFVIGRSKEPGQTVGTAEPILVMADQLIIEADVDETDLRYITLGQKVDIVLDAYSDKRFRGAVEHIAYESKIVNNVTVYAVKIRPLSVPQNFRAGMTATIEVEAQKKDDALLLPYDAVTDRDGAKTVLLRSANGRPEARKIETGITDGKRIEIVSGIEDGDTILVAKPESAARKKQQRPGGFFPGPGMGGRRH